MTFQAKENYLKNNEGLDKTEKSRVEQEWVSTVMKERIVRYHVAANSWVLTHAYSQFHLCQPSRDFTIHSAPAWLDRSDPGHANMPVSYTSLFFCLGRVPEEHVAFS